MHWLEQNDVDATLRGRYDLSPLDTAPIIDEKLIDEVITHNQAVQEIKVRFDMLADARYALSRPDDWNVHNAEDVIAEQRRVVAESWDILVLLRHWIDERKELTRKIDAHIGGQMDEMTERHDAAFDAIHQKLERANRQYLKTEPHNAQPWITQQAAADEEVSNLRERIDDLDQIRKRYVSIRQNLEVQNALTLRQREVFPHLN